MLEYLPQLFKNNIISRDLLPLELIVFVTQRCNLSCRHCFVEKEEGAQGELTLAEFERLSQGIPRLISLMLTGGEPFLRGDLPEIIRVFDRNSRPRVISIITNGTLEANIKQALDKLQDSGIKAEIILSVSIDGDAAIHNRIRAQDNAYSSLEKTIEVIKAHPLRKKILFGMNITLCQDNHDLPYEIYQKILAEANMDFASVNLIRGRSPGEYKDVDIDKYGRLCKLINKHNKIRIKHIPKVIRQLHGIKEEYQAHLIRDIYLNRTPQGLTCEAGRNIGVIDAKGNVYPCELINTRLGSIRTESLKSIWNNPENISFIRDFVRKKKCFCHHECFISASINLNIFNQLRSLLWYIFLRKRK